MIFFEGEWPDGECKMLKNILVVEDEPASLECISQFLRKAGYGVSEARDGAEAIELIDKSRFDLVLTDVRMPRLDGVALATHILSRIPTIPIIMMTAFPSEDLRPIWGYGIPCLSKPLSLDELRSNVQRALR
jgi:CheY-like chemotaxis protein